MTARVPHDPGPAFRALHRRGDPFVLANAWDVGSARIMAALGAPAIGTSSAGYAATLGLPDFGPDAPGRDRMLAHVEDLVRATPLPVSADLADGYGEAPDAVAESVRLACEAGVAGISIEDVDRTGLAYSADLATERIRAAVAAVRAAPRDLVLVARADGLFARCYDLEEGLSRLRAFEAAGADCLYLPAPPDFESLARICAGTALPVNALVSGSFAQLPRTAFAEIGVARLSLGSALARSVLGALVSTLGDIVAKGDFKRLSAALPQAELETLLARGTV
ncbi:isocitrate lyase/phosphoenolpyruvate mutase family protein [Salinarimonas sp.]|uniref:isocitrate lyase/PEP mutase family protein n=1 Tax=Salinarimonas sp. TaxID=2766526 RepID=UPI0032D9382E